MAATPNVLLFVFDTLRPDFLTPYESDSAYETPAFERFATEGTLFEEAYAVGPNSEVSHGGLFTGRYPSESGLVGGAHNIPDIPTIPTWFDERGYETYGISGPSKIRSDLGFERGFDRYVETYREALEPEPSLEYLSNVLSDQLVRRDAFRTLSKGPESVTSLKFDLLRRALREREQPIFAFMNVLTCHTPYNPPRPFKEEATPELDRPRWFLTEFISDRLGLNPEQFDSEGVRTERILAAAGGNGGPYLGDQGWLNESELNVLRAWYRACVQYLDQQFGQFLDWLDTTGLAEDSIVVVLSDHGEHLGEHGLLYHGHLLYDETIHVPLLFRGPGVPSGAIRDDFVSLIDVFDTLCGLTGVPAPDDTDGRGLFEADYQQRNAIFAEYGERDVSSSKFDEYLDGEQRERFDCGRKCIRTRQHKYVIRSDGKHQLYALPDEDRIENPDIAERLHDRLAAELGTEFLRTAGHFEEEDPRVEQNLRDLGYI